MSRKKVHGLHPSNIPVSKAMLRFEADAAKAGVSFRRAQEKSWATFRDTLTRAWKKYVCEVLPEPPK